jgi:hypothetical protein
MAATPAVVEAGLDRLHVDFGFETDRGRRFALWCLCMLGQAPDLDASRAALPDRQQVNQRAVCPKSGCRISAPLRSWSR